MKEDWLGDQNLRGINLKRMQGIQNCPTIAATSDVARAFNEVSLLPDCMWIAGALDSKFRMVSWNIVGIGATPYIRPIDVFAGAIDASVKNSFLVRNEPYTSTSSESFDVELLKSLCETSTLLGYSFLDFVVVGKHFCRSVFYESKFSRDINASLGWECSRQSRKLELTNTRQRMHSIKK